MRPAFTRFLAAACRTRGMSCVSLRLPAAFEPTDGRLRIEERAANDDCAHRDCSHAISAYSIAMVRSARTSTVRSASRAQSSGVLFVAMDAVSKPTHGTARKIAEPVFRHLKAAGRGRNS